MKYDHKHQLKSQKINNQVNVENVNNQYRNCLLISKRFGQQSSNFELEDVSESEQLGRATKNCTTRFKKNPAFYTFMLIASVSSVNTQLNETINTIGNNKSKLA